jgi:hypothetical protein
MLVPLQKPHLTAQGVFDVCKSTVTDADFKARLDAIVGDIVAAEAAYEALAPEALFQMAQSVDVGLVQGKEMSWLYSNKLVDVRCEGRKFYDQIMASAKNNACPFCEHRDVATLDHILPRQKFAALAVAPSNLVPACYDCNFLKRAFVADCYEDMPFHPYYDNIAGELWLHASVVESDPCAVTFSAVPPEAWPDSKKFRLTRQFQKLDLARLYSSQATTELGDKRLALHEIHTAGGVASVRLELDREFRSRRANRINSWRTALSKALSESNWYCDGGFRLGAPQAGLLNG